MYKKDTGERYPARGTSHCCTVALSNLLAVGWSHRRRSPVSFFTSSVRLRRSSFIPNMYHQQIKTAALPNLREVVYPYRTPIVGHSSEIYKDALRGHCNHRNDERVPHKVSLSVFRIKGLVRATTSYTLGDSHRSYRTRRSIKRARW